MTHENRGTLRVVSVSLGSSSRDKEARVRFAGYDAHVRRTGVDGDKARMERVLRELDADPAVDCIALGGIDLLWVVGDREYRVRDAQKLASVVESKPVVCGYGVKATLELRGAESLFERGHLRASHRVLFLSLAERYALGRLIWSHGCPMVFGDLMFTLGLPFPLRRLRTAELLSRFTLPLARRVPIQFFYPQGAAQETRTPRFEEHFAWADVIAGDFLLLKKYAPDDLKGKIVLTNTTTAADREWLAASGVHELITLTPRVDGRTFGANVYEALVVAALLREGVSPSLSSYSTILERDALSPAVEVLDAGSA